MGLALQKYGQYEYTMRQGRKQKYRKHMTFAEMDKFDLVLYPVDVRPDRVMKAHVPPEKLVMMIRSDVFKLCSAKRRVYYEETKFMSRRVKAFMCANNYLFELFKKKYQTRCYYAPGGVDTEIFKPANKEWHKRPVVGWAGSRDNFNKDIRGLYMIEDACHHLGYEFKPAYREDKWRSQEEMVKYYQEEIDIYIDAFRAAGRQNGLLEAGACGLPLVSLPVGIGRELIDAGVCKRISEFMESVVEALKLAWDFKATLQGRVVPYIQKEWSWKTHVARWENEIFKELV
jgi:hypothetical protein